MRYLLFIFLMLITAFCYANIYTSVDANGNVTYTDKPTNENQTKVNLPPANTVQSSAPPAPESQTDVTTYGAANPSPANAPLTTNANKPYTKFAILSPGNEETIQNQPNINITIDIQPSLQEGDMIQIYLDGAPWGKPLHNTTFVFTAPDRGTHTLSATLFDKKMGVLKQSNTNTIYVHHAHL